MVRANAYQEAGWTPTWTLTEDFALGMEMKRNGWHCRYLNQYLAVGEAPDGVRNCFQQRSRWTKARAPLPPPNPPSRQPLPLQFPPPPAAALRRASIQRLKLRCRLLKNGGAAS